LDVNLEADDGLVLGEDFRRECEGCGHCVDFINAEVRRGARW
jgi:hypothetical protein